MRALAVFTAAWLGRTVHCLQESAAPDCHACEALSEDQCLATLTNRLDSLSDKNRLAILRTILFKSQLQVASGLPQINRDSAHACTTLSDEECLAALNAELCSLSNEHRLSYLVRACGLPHYWSALSSTSSGGGGTKARLFAFTISAFGVGALGVAATTAFMRRRRVHDYRPIRDLELETADS